MTAVWTPLSAVPWSVSMSMKKGKRSVKEISIMDLDITDLKPSYHTIKDFTFQSGEKLGKIEMEYFTTGKAQRDENGKITNGLLFLHGWSGDYSSFKRFLDFTRPGEPFDADKYFIISTTSLGSPGSSAPSTSGLGKDFPHYTIGDMVNAQHRLLKDQLDVDHLKGVIGASMGGFQSLEWGVSYPDSMDYLIHLVTGPAVMGRNCAIFQFSNTIIESHPDYMNGNYRENPHIAVLNVNKFMFLFIFTIPYYHEVFADKNPLNQAFSGDGAEDEEMDARDVVWRNNACLSFDVREDLDKIKAKSLVIGIEGDEYFPPQIEAIPLSNAIKNSELLVYKSSLGHLGINEIEKMRDVLIDFIGD